VIRDPPQYNGRFNRGRQELLLSPIFSLPCLDLELLGHPPPQAGFFARQATNETSRVCHQPNLRPGQTSVETIPSSHYCRSELSRPFTFASNTHPEHAYPLKGRCPNKLQAPSTFFFLLDFFFFCRKSRSLPLPTREHRLAQLSIRFRPLNGGMKPYLKLEPLSGTNSPIAGPTSSLFLE